MAGLIAIFAGTERRTMKLEKAWEFYRQNSFCQSVRVLWSDCTQDQFPFEVDFGELMQFETPQDYIESQALSFFPGRHKNEVKRLWMVF
jgi:hypothetical protein